MRKYVRLDEGHCLECISEATGIVMFPPDTTGVCCDRHAAEWAAYVVELKRLEEVTGAEIEARRRRCDRRGCGRALPYGGRVDARYCSPDAGQRPTASGSAQPFRWVLPAVLVVAAVLAW